LLPSPISAAVSIVFGLAVVGGYLVTQSVSIGTSLPDLFEGEWGVAYTNNIVQPLTTIFSNTTFGKAATAFVWGLGGLAVYIIVELATRTYHGLHEAKNNVQITGATVIHHPGLRDFFVALGWRIAVVGLFSVVFAVLVLPLAHSLAEAAPTIILGKISVPGVVRKLLPLVAGCALTAHLLTVFLRLFAMRMRLFGEIEY
jgi:hypothetical protein